MTSRYLGYLLTAIILLNFGICIYLYRASEKKFLQGSVMYIADLPYRGDSYWFAQNLYNLFCNNDRVTTCKIRISDANGNLVAESPLNSQSAEGLVGLREQIDLFSPPLHLDVTYTPKPASYFSYSLLFLFFSAIVILLGWLLRSSQARTRLELKSKETELLKSRVENAKRLVSISIQVAHDIRSPLSALKVLASSLPDITTDKQNLINGVIQRITDISSDLLAQAKSEKERSDTGFNIAKVSTSLQHILEAMVKEKREQYSRNAGVEFRLDIASTDQRTLVFDEGDLSRTLSNLIDNSVDALDGKNGVVTIGLKGDSDHTFITISDTGKGIPDSHLKRLGEKGVSIGKVGGNGLGIYQARIFAESAGGELTISSKFGVGTTVTVGLRGHRS